MIFQKFLKFRVIIKFNLDFTDTLRKMIENMTTIVIKQYLEQKKVFHFKQK